MANAGCINAYDCAGCYLTTLQQLQSDNIGVAINYTAPSEYWRRQLDYIKYTDKCGCTCCLTGENELRIVATQWVIKNFTLTNGDTNEVVNVKWNDLFGSNRAYTMVRYKTGSYPTSITDGTLAVKETTQNQYATNGYNVSWLTDWTTYYFTAFAVSQDGTIIVVQSNFITTDFWRKPTTDTLLYLPLESDVVDMSWKSWRTFTTSSISYTTVWWVQSIHVWTSWWIKLTSPYPLQSDITKPLTVSVLIYRTWTWNWNILDMASTGHQRLNCTIRSWNIWIAPWEFNSSTDNFYARLSTPQETNKRFLITYTISTTATKLYIDWELKQSWNWWRYPRSYWNRNRDNTQWILSDRSVWTYNTWLNWNARELIIEEKERTADDISSYNSYIKNKLWIV